MIIKEVIEENEKTLISRNILENLKDWFEVDDAREEYINKSKNWPFFAAYTDNKPIGFLCLKETGNATLELAVMGVLLDHQRNGVGRKLFEAAKEYAKNNNYEFIQVKTVKMGVYDEYDQTNKFYISLGFKELEVIQTIWDDKNPCQIYIMYIK